MMNSGSVALTLSNQRTMVKIQQCPTAYGGDQIAGRALQIVGEELCEALVLGPGAKVLDVATSDAMTCLATTPRWCDVASTDHAPRLPERAQAQAGVADEFLKADTETLPFDDETFDAVVSSFGVMFTSNPIKAAAELLRVCKARGQIGLASWTPEGFIGRMFRMLGKYLPPSASIRSPTIWGTREHLVEMFGPVTTGVKTQRRQFTFRYRSPEHFLDVFDAFCGPLQSAIAALDDQRRTVLTNELYALILRMNTASDGTMIVPSEYLEIVIAKR